MHENMRRILLFLISIFIPLTIITDIHANTVSSCQFSACNGNECCREVVQQKSSCLAILQENRSKASKFGDAGRMAIQATEECVRCASVYLKRICQIDSPEANWSPRRIDYDGYEKASIDRAEVSTSVIQDERAAMRGFGGPQAPTLDTGLAGFISSIAAGLTGQAAINAARTPRSHVNDCPGGGGRRSAVAGGGTPGCR